MVLDQFRQIDIEWDIANQYQASPTLAVVAGGSSNSQLLTVSILNAGQREDLSSVSAAFVWRNLTNGDNGSAEFAPYDTNSGSFQISLPDQMLGVASKGTVTANIVLTKPDPDGFVITSRALSFTIENSAMASVAFADSSDSNLFQQILQNWQKLPSDYAAAISAANDSAASLATSLASTASSVNASIAASATSSVAALASSLAVNVSSASDIVSSLIAGDASMDSYLQSQASSAESSMASMATSALNGLLKNSAAVTLDSLVVDDSSGVASYTENVATSGSAVSRPMTTTAGFWSAFKTWLTGFIGKSTAAFADDLSVGKTLPFPPNLLNLIYPVGSIYQSMNAANPATFFGGSWTAIGQGKTLVGVDTGQAEFNTVNKTGGEKTHTLTISEMPIHNHEVSPYDVGVVSGYGFASGGAPNTGGPFVPQNMNSQDNGTLSSGGGMPHNNLQPYLTVYIWERTA